jgi:hypothetical protein
VNNHTMHEFLTTEKVDEILSDLDKASLK